MSIFIHPDIFLITLIAFAGIAGISFSQSADLTESGNVTAINLADENSSVLWAGFVGNVITTNTTNTTIAKPSNVSGFDLYAPSCAYGISLINYYFSNASTFYIASLVPGNLSILDNFISDARQNGTSTFANVTRSYTNSLGTLANVPTVYTNTADSQLSFYEGYLNDGDGSMVFILPPNFDKIGYNGSIFDFQIMLPTNGADLTYSVFLEQQCNSAPTVPSPTSVPPSGSVSGGGSSVTPKSRPPPTLPGVPTEPGGQPSGAKFKSMIVLKRTVCPDQKLIVSLIDSTFREPIVGATITVSLGSKIVGIDATNEHGDVFFDLPSRNYTVAISALQDYNDTGDSSIFVEECLRTIYGFSGKSIGTVDSEHVITVLKNDKPYPNAVVLLERPDGTKQKLHADAEGNLKIYLEFSGAYELTLMVGGAPITTKSVASVEKEDYLPFISIAMAAVLTLLLLLDYNYLRLFRKLTE